MIGAVVGVQPFGGEGLSGTGPKAGGPFYLERFAAMPATPAEVTAAPDPVVTATSAAPNLEGLHAGHRDWARASLAQRVAAVHRSAARLDAATGASLRNQADQALGFLADRELPGPTGESNTLRLHARGVFALLGSNAAPSDTASALAAALLGGNSALLVGAADGEALRAAFTAGGVPANAIATCAADAAGALLAAPLLAGVCVAAGGDEMLRQVARALADRPGAILPLITGAEARCPTLLWRFCAEQTVTINTAAAGGNAELLAMVGKG